MKAHIPENLTPNLEEIIDSNKMIESIFENLGEGEDAGLKAVFSALALPEREFAFVSEQILNECEKSINNVEDKLTLVQALNASGMKAEDLTSSFIELGEQIDKTLAGQYSQQKMDFLKRFIGILVNAINDTEGIAKKMVPVPIQLCHPDAQHPVYAKAGDAGMDLYAVEDITINPGETVIVPTGIKVALPLGYALLVHPRSGISAKTKMRVGNSIGLIDSGYRGEIGVIIDNIEPAIKNIDYHFNETGEIIIDSIVHGSAMHITKGQRFAQLRLVEVPSCVFYDINDVSEIDGDRASGFGGTGNF